jgi:hypothetical protein
LIVVGLSVSSLSAFNKGHCIGQSRRLSDFLLARSQTVVTNVISKSSRKDCRLLPHNSKLAP